MPESYSTQMQATISKLRRAIGDTVIAEQEFTDADLYSYISDAVDELEMGDYVKNTSVGIISDGDDEIGDFVNSQGASLSISVTEQTLYSKKAQYLIVLGGKSSSDRTSINITKKNLSVSTQDRPRNHAETLKILDTELRRIIYRLTDDIVGVRVE